MSLRTLGKIEKILTNQVQLYLQKSAAGAPMSIEELEILNSIARTMTHVKAFRWKRAADVRKAPFRGSAPLTDEDLLARAEAGNDDATTEE